MAPCPTPFLSRVCQEKRLRLMIGRATATRHFDRFVNQRRSESQCRVSVLRRIVKEIFPEVGLLGNGRRLALLSIIAWGFNL